MLANVGKLKTVLFDPKSFSDVANKDALKTVYNTTGLVKKTVYDTKTTEIENKIPSITNSIKKLIMTRS